MLGYFLKEIGKVIVVSTGVKVVQEHIVPPVADKVKKKLKKKNNSSHSDQEVADDDVESYTVECEAKWE